MIGTVTVGGSSSNYESQTASTAKGVMKFTIVLVALRGEVLHLISNFYPTCATSFPIQERNINTHLSFDNLPELQCPFLYELFLILINLLLRQCFTFKLVISIRVLKYLVFLLFFHCFLG